MSFSWSIEGKNGIDLLEKYGIHFQGLGLAPNCPSDTPARYRLSDLRSIFDRSSFKDKLPEAAQAAILDVQEMLRANLDELQPHHCDTCSCPAKVPIGWSVEDARRFLSIPIDEVQSADGGY